MQKYQVKNNELLQQLTRLSLDERAALLVALARSVANEAGNRLPPGPVAHCANLRNAASEVQRVLKIDYDCANVEVGESSNTLPPARRNTHHYTPLAQCRFISTITVKKTVVIFTLHQSDSQRVFARLPNYI